MNKSLFSVVIVAAIAALGFGLYFGNNAQKAKTQYVQQLQTATVLPQGRPIANFDLTNNEGKPFTNQSLKGHWTLFFFGFTNCPHICPMTMAELQKAYKIMEQQKIPTPTVMLVSVDPKRDTVARMDAYVKGFNPDFQGATGSKQAIDNLAKSLNILYMKVVPRKGNKENYDVEHSGSILLIDPQGQFKALFSMPHKAKQIAHDFSLIQKYNS